MDESGGASRAKSAREARFMLSFLLVQVERNGPVALDG
jgi:hypothetical protein